MLHRSKNPSDQSMPVIITDCRLVIGKICTTDFDRRLWEVSNGLTRRYITFIFRDSDDFDGEPSEYTDTMTALHAVRADDLVFKSALDMGLYLEKLRLISPQFWVFMHKARWEAGWTLEKFGQQLVVLGSREEYVQRLETLGR